MSWHPRAGGAGEEAVGCVPPLTENFNEGVRVVPAVFRLNISLYICYHLRPQLMLESRIKIDSL